VRGDDTHDRVAISRGFSKKRESGMGPEGGKKAPERPRKPMRLAHLHLETCGRAARLLRDKRKVVEMKKREVT